MNPYNFVRFPEGTSRGAFVAPGSEAAPDAARYRVPGHEAFHTGFLSGVIRVRIEPLTPLWSAAPAPRDTGADGFQRFRFLRDTAGRGVLPGSSVRGTIRGVLEALAAGCASQAALPDSASWRPVASSTPGILEGGWVREVAPVLVPDDRPPIGWEAPLGGVWRDGQSVWFRARPQGRSRVATQITAKEPGDSGWERGLLHITDRPEGGTKKHQRIFPLEGIGKPHVVPPETLADSDKAHELTRRSRAEGFGTPDWGGKGVVSTDYSPLAAAGTEAVPVWFRMRDGRVCSIGRAALYRELHRSQPIDLLPRNVEPCLDGPTVCWSCALLGRPLSRSAEGATSFASRVRFGEFRTGEPLIDRSTRKLRRSAMGNPSVSADIFYVTRRDRYGQEAALEEPEAILRGRKFYWHQPLAAEDERPYARRPGHEGSGFDKLTPEIEVLLPGNALEGKVRFWNLDEADLGLLLASLDPQLLQPEGRLYHKFGGAKPLGLGSAKVALEVRLINRGVRYSSFETDGVSAPADVDQIEAWVGAFASQALAFRKGLPEKGGLPSLLDEEDIADLLLMLDYETAAGFSRQDSIHYPPGHPDRTDPGFVRSFEWFQRRGSKSARLPSRRAKQGRAELDPLRTPQQVREGFGQRPPQPPPER